MVQIPPTPTAPPAELIEQAVRVIDIWQTLGPLMAVLLVAAMAIAVVFANNWINRNSSSSAINVLSHSNTQKEKELEESKTQREQDRQQHVESIRILSEQSTRANDLWEAMNNRSGERDKQQQRMVEAQEKIASDLGVIINDGSTPVREIKTKVGEIVNIVTAIDSRTADWDGILQVITPLLIELGALRTEAKKHRTQPIAPITMPIENNTNGLPPVLT